jgi:hypothetical protein
MAGVLPLSRRGGKAFADGRRLRPTHPCFNRDQLWLNFHTKHFLRSDWQNWFSHVFIDGRYWG